MTTQQQTLENNGYLTLGSESDGDLGIQCRHSSKGFGAGGVFTPGLGSTRNSLIALEFECAPASRLSDKFRSAMLARLIGDAQVQPLIKLSDFTLALVYRHDGDDWELEDANDKTANRAWQHGLAFADSYATAQLQAVRTPIALEGSWGDDRTPLTVKREDLPLWEPVDVRGKLQGIIDEMGDDIRVKGIYAPKTAPVDPLNSRAHNFEADPRIARMNKLKADIERAQATKDPAQIKTAELRYYSYLMAPTTATA